MNSKIFSLTKVFLKNSFQNMSTYKKKNKDEKKSSTKMILLYAFLFLYLGAIFGVMSYSMIEGLIQIKQEQVFLSLFFLAISMLLLIQSIFTCMNVFYFSKDVEYILPLPLKPREIVIAKFNTILVTEYITEAIFGIIPLGIYGILTQAGIGYYIMTLASLLVFPILPILISSLLVMLVMSFAKFTKNKDKFQLITTIIVIVVVVGMQFFLSGSQDEMTSEELAEKLVEANGMVSLVSNYFITLQPTVNALSSSNLWISFIELLKVVGITILAYIIVVSIGQKIYLRGAIGNRSGNGKKYKKINEKKAFNLQKVGVSYVKKEIKTLMRNPIFFMQCVLPAFLMPIVMIIAMLASMGDSQEVQSMSLMLANLPLTMTLVLLRNTTVFINHDICSSYSRFTRWPECCFYEIYSSSAIQTISL